ncbi:dual specificity protein phosphatase 18 [Discoglossus pictus]
MTEQREGGAIPPYKTKIISLSGLKKVTDCLYLSNATAAKNKALLTKHCITCVINISLEKSDDGSPDQEYIHFPLADSPDTFLFAHFDTIADKIHSVEANGGCTLLHCVAGISRSPTLCLAYLMKYNGLSLLAAHDWLKKCRPIIRPNIAFWEQLVSYEMSLFGKNTVEMVTSPTGSIPNIYAEESKNMITF